MLIGALSVDIHIPEAHSLKDKRRVIQSLIETTRRKFNVSISEIDNQDLWQLATLGIVCVSNDGRFVNKALDNVLDMLEANGDIQIGQTVLEIL